MSASPSIVLPTPSPAFPTLAAHAHDALEACPTCEQPIPKDRAEEITQRIAAHQAAQNEALTARLQQAFAREKSAALEAVRQEGTAALELERTQSAERVVAAREETRIELEASVAQRLEAANASHEERIADLQRTHQEQNADSEARVTELRSQLQATHDQHAAEKERIQLEAQQSAEATVQEQLATWRQEKEVSDSALRGQIESLQAANVATEDQRLTLQKQFSEAETAHSAAIEKMHEESASREALAREQGIASATATMQEQLATWRQEKEVSDSALHGQIESLRAANVATEDQRLTLQKQFSEAETAHSAAIEKMQEESASRETRAREQGIASATATMQEQLTQSQKEQAEALARVEAVQADRATIAEQLQTANSQLQAQKESHNAEIARVVQETRDAMEKDKTDALNAEQAKRLQETQKLTASVDDLKRQLEKKTADDLGEGAELDLFEELKSRFEHDLIRRVPHGVAGADIIHEIREHNVVCGKIVYDCKNRKDWKYEYTTKLRTDKIAEKADHAVLSTNKFPAGTKQLHVHENVIIACPARVMMVAEILREQVILLHTTRSSLKAREEKSQELYTFMTSAQSAELFDTVDTQISKLEKIDEDELRAHKTVWDRRGKVIKSLEKAHGNLRFEVRRIVGALDADGTE